MDSNPPENLKHAPEFRFAVTSKDTYNVGAIFTRAAMGFGFPIRVREGVVTPDGKIKEGSEDQLTFMTDSSDSLNKLRNLQAIAALNNVYAYMQGVSDGKPRDL